MTTEELLKLKNEQFNRLQSNILCILEKYDCDKKFDDNEDLKAMIYDIDQVLINS